MFRKITAALAALLVSIALWLGLVRAVDSGVSGDAPTTNTDGSTITNLTSIRVHRAIVAAGVACPAVGPAYSVLATVPFTAAGGRFSYVDANLSQSGRYCYRATAVLATGAESALSTSVGFKDVDLRIPNAPTSITVN